jgi:nitroreductase
MDAIEAISTRRSVREFTDEPVSAAELDRAIEAARWAPSGLNNQPWRFMKVEDRSLINDISVLTKYRGVMAGAAALIAVFLDGQDTYDRTKDLMAVGAAVENLLLAAHEEGLGACWLGEILARRSEVEALLEVSDDLELVAVIAMGRPATRERSGVRHPLDKILLTPPER